MSDPQPAAAWQNTPTTAVIGRFDDEPGADDIAALAAAVPDTRVIECDHFTIFRAPGPVSGAILDGFDSDQS